MALVWQGATPKCGARRTPRSSQSARELASKWPRLESHCDVPNCWLPKRSLQANRARVATAWTATARPRLCRLLTFFPLICLPPTAGHAATNKTHQSAALPGPDRRGPARPSRHAVRRRAANLHANVRPKKCRGGVLKILGCVCLPGPSEFANSRHTRPWRCREVAARLVSSGRRRPHAKPHGLRAPKRPWPR